MLPVFGLALLLSLASAYNDPRCLAGRSGIVELFEWTWDDIGKECLNFLGPYGFCAVQTSPAQENRIVTDPNRPWWERYQPVSFKLETRSGDEEAFQRMIRRCGRSGVRVFVDVVINHMTGAGTEGNGTAGSPYDANTFSYPGVPYSAEDFNDYGERCHTWESRIYNNWNAEEVRNCRLYDLLDLNLSKDHVRDTVAEYLNKLLDMGVDGFKIDAAKHIWPSDLEQILSKVKDMKSGHGRPFVYQDVYDLGYDIVKGEEYFGTGRITNFRAGRELATVFRRQNALKWLENWGPAWNMWNTDEVVTFLDSPTTQRDHASGGAVLTYKESRAYKLATAFMLAHPYGEPRIMSSYAFEDNRDFEGPPHNEDMSTKNVEINDMICENGWICEHRWRQIYNMLAFRNMARDTQVKNWWSGSDNSIAFSRGSRAFIAFNLEDWELNQVLQTGLPAGTYCDVITGNLENDQCTGKSVTVAEDGTAQINVCADCEDPMLAIHIGARVGYPEKRY